MHARSLTPSLRLTRGRFIMPPLTARICVAVAVPLAENFCPRGPHRARELLVGGGTKIGVRMGSRGRSCDGSGVSFGRGGAFGVGHRRVYVARGLLDVAERPGAHPADRRGKDPATEAL